MMSMGWYKKDVTPLLTDWSYVFIALAHRWVNRVLTNMRSKGIDEEARLAPVLGYEWPLLNTMNPWAHGMHEQIAGCLPLKLGWVPSNL